MINLDDITARLPSMLPSSMRLVIGELIAEVRRLRAENERLRLEQRRGHREDTEAETWPKPRSPWSRWKVEELAGIIAGKVPR